MASQEEFLYESTPLELILTAIENANSTKMSDNIILKFMPDGMVRQFLWLIGKEEKLFFQYYRKEKELYCLRDDAPAFLTEEPKRRDLHQGDGETLSIQFRPINIDRVAAVGNLRLLKFIYNRDYKNYPDPEYQFSYTTMVAAAKNGRLDCLKFLHEIKCNWEFSVIIEAAQYGHLDCLKYAVENGCPMCSTACHSAIESGHIECLKYLVEHDCPTMFVCDEAARYGRLYCLDYLLSKGFERSARTCAYAAANGHLECLILLREKGCPWTQTTIIDANRNNQLVCLAYARQNGCPEPESWSLQPNFQFIRS